MEMIYVNITLIIILYVSIQGLEGTTDPQCTSSALSLSMTTGVCQFDTDQGIIDLSALNANPGPKYVYLLFISLHMMP